MKENTQNIINREKKVWTPPNITQMHINQTKSGNINANTEGSFWIFNWGPQPS